MKKLFLFLSLVLITSCSSKKVVRDYSAPQVKYLVDVTNNEDDLFHVTVYTSNLSTKNKTYNFAATAPGTYQILDFGRFVKSFKAFDINGGEISVNRISTNRWEISDPGKLSYLKYDIEDTFDAEVEEHVVISMGGSGIEEKFVAMNTFAVLGYFQGLQSIPVELELNYKSHWIIGTALEFNEAGFYFAETYDHLADSPILIGELTVEETKVNDIDVGIYVFCKDSATTARTIMQMTDDVLQSSSGFIGYSPVTHYKFLMCLLNEETYANNNILGGGALEHSYSSLYVYPSRPRGIPRLRDFIAHEFLHILTPLNLHSEIIHKYNFAVPTSSQHIWLYEGVTEWGADIMQLRSGLIDVNTYMRRISRKINSNENFEPVSLVEMSLTSYTQVGYGNFLNFYEKGAVTAALLDIKLLELSEGERGLKEVFIDLLEKYGKNKPFPENGFFEVFVEETNPEIEEFINNYIKGTEPLPYKEYFAKIGFTYIPERNSESTRPSLGTGFSVNQDSELIAQQVMDEAKKWGLQEGDVFLEVWGHEISLATFRKVFGEVMQDKKIGDPLEFTIRRDDKVIKIKGTLLQPVDKHVFVEMETLTDQQKMLREAWSKNL